MDRLTIRRGFKAMSWQVDQNVQFFVFFILFGQHPIIRTQKVGRWKEDLQTFFLFFWSSSKKSR